MVRPPDGMNPYEFVVMAAQRAQQLMRGCVARADGNHKATVLAQMEVSAGSIGRAVPLDPPAADAGAEKPTPAGQTPRSTPSPL